MEVRGLSMPDTAEVATRAVIAVVDATNRFLSKLRQRERTEHVRIVPRRAAEQVFRSYVT